MILFYLQTLRAWRHIPIFLKFLHNKILINVKKKLLKMFLFFVYVVFFYWKEIENEKTKNVTI